MSPEPRCPTCGSANPMFRCNLWWKGAFAGVCPDEWHPSGASSPGAAVKP